MSPTFLVSQNVFLSYIQLGNDFLPCVMPKFWLPDNNLQKYPFVVVQYNVYFGLCDLGSDVKITVSPFVSITLNCPVFSLYHMATLYEWQNCTDEWHERQIAPWPFDVLNRCYPFILNGEKQLLCRDDEQTNFEIKM